MMRKTWVYAFLALGAAAISCGGAVDTGLFGDAPAGADSPDGAASSDAAGGHTDGGTMRADGGGRGDGGVSMDGGFTDASMGKDGGPPPPTNTIDCNTVATTCKLGTQVCCRSGDAPPSFACSAPAGCLNISDMPIPCDDANDCDKLGHPGELCCAQTAAGKATSVGCSATCGVNSTNLCDPLAADPCPNGGSCQVSVTTLPGFHICF